MTVHPLPRTRPWSGTATGLRVALELIEEHRLPDCRVLVWDDGRTVVLDYSERFHAALEVHSTANVLDAIVQESPVNLPDGTAAIQHRADALVLRGTDSIRVVVKADVPVPATWPSTR